MVKTHVIWHTLPKLPRKGTPVMAWNIHTGELTITTLSRVLTWHGFKLKLGNATHWAYLPCPPLPTEKLQRNESNIYKNARA